MDGTPELDTGVIQYFQELTGMLRWETEIRRNSVIREVSILSQYQVSPRQGYMEQLLHIWAYLDKTPKLTLYFDLARPNIDYGDFKTDRKEFQEQYIGADGEIPRKMPVTRWKLIVTTASIDAYHATNKR